MGRRIDARCYLSDSNYETLLVGKWHVGEAIGMRPHDVGFDEFYGYYRAQKEYLQSIDQNRYPRSGSRSAKSCHV